MKSLVLISIALFSINAFAFAPSYDGRPELNLVLGVDKTAFADESPLRFPCTQLMGRVTCGQIKFENAVCERTFFVDRFVNKLELSCLVGLNKKVVIGYADARTFAPPSTQLRYGHYPLQLTNKVSLKRDSSANVILSLKP